MLDMMSGWATTVATPTQETTAVWIRPKILSGNSGQVRLCYGPSASGYRTSDPLIKVYQEATEIWTPGKVQSVNSGQVGQALKSRRVHNELPKFTNIKVYHNTNKDWEPNHGKFKKPMRSRTHSVKTGQVGLVPEALRIEKEPPTFTNIKVYTDTNKYR